jgi:hypothetical protein
MDGFLHGSGRGVWQFLILPPKDPSPSHPDRGSANNVMTRNNQLANQPTVGDV